MKTLTIKHITLQVDAQKNSVAEVQKIIEVVNIALQEANLNCQPQIFLDGIRPDKTIAETVFDLRK